VPEGLRANIRGKRLDNALTSFITAVRTLAPTAFPWADRITVSSNWSYVWWEDQQEIVLPATDDNTVAEPATAAEEAALTDGIDAQS
jgi:hypothetical protein